MNIHKLQTQTQLSFLSSPKKRILSQETKDKISKALKGKTPSQETRDKISKALKGITRSEETRKKLSEAGKNRPFTQEHCENLSKAMKKVRKEKKELTRMHQEAQKLLWESNEGLIIKKALSEYFAKQNPITKKTLYQTMNQQDLKPDEKTISLNFWKKFWESHQDLLKLYKKAIREAYEKIKNNNDKI